MSADANETRFHEILKDIELDLRYAEFCASRFTWSRRNGSGLDLPTIKERVAELPLPFAYRRSESFFQHREKIADGVTLLFHLSVRSTLVEPMIYLKVERDVYGDPLAMLTVQLLKGRPGTEPPEPRRLALLFADADDLSTALDFVARLFLEVRANVRSGAPWLPMTPTGITGRDRPRGA